MLLRYWELRRWYILWRLPACLSMVPRYDHHMRAYQRGGGPGMPRQHLCRRAADSIIKAHSAGRFNSASREQEPWERRLLQC